MSSRCPTAPTPLQEILRAIVCYKGLRPGFPLIEIDCFLCGKLNRVNFKLSSLSFALYATKASVEERSVKFWSNETETLFFFFVRLKKHRKWIWDAEDAFFKRQIKDPRDISFDPLSTFHRNATFGYCSHICPECNRIIRATPKFTFEVAQDSPMPVLAILYVFMFLLLP